MVELTAYDKTFELPNNGNEIKYTKQIADIFDLAVVASSYTNGFTIPKTPHNTEIMNQLGIVGDTSQIPYSKVPSSLKHYGFDLFRNGWLAVRNTNEDYIVSVADGMIDFFKAIENKTMGKDLDLSNFNHIKDLPSVLASFTNDFYKYIVADYNGKNFGINGEDEGINIDYLVPCFSVRKLMDLVMSTYGFQYNIANIEDINEWYITYPKSPAEDQTPVEVFQANRAAFVTPPYDIGGGFYSAPPAISSWTSSIFTEGVLINNWKYQIAETSGYIINFDAEMYARYSSSFTNEGGQYYSELFRKTQLSILVNGLEVVSYINNQNYTVAPTEQITGSVTLPLNEGDIIEYIFKAPSTILFVTKLYTMFQIRCNSINIEVLKTNLGDVNLSDAFKDYQIKDFVKEIFIREATTPIINNFSSDISFKTISERLDFENADDWSDKFVRRTNETYIQGSYAQKNGFTHKHDDSDDISFNGYVFVNNQNIPDYKDLYQSKTFAPINTLFEFATGVSTLKLKVWNRETKEDAEGSIGIEYKGLNNRFFVLKYKMSPEASYKFVSEAIPQIDSVLTFPYADLQGMTYDQIIPKKYSSYNGVLNNFRAHEIDLALSLNDFIGLDMSRPKYFSQEGSYYSLNRLIFSEGGTVSGEFIRINKATK
jgi:hypothetical protein